MRSTVSSQILRSSAAPLTAPILMPVGRPRRGEARTVDADPDRDRDGDVVEEVEAHVEQRHQAEHAEQADERGEGGDGGVAPRAAVRVKILFGQPTPHRGSLTPHTTQEATAHG